MARKNREAEEMTEDDGFNPVARSARTKADTKVIAIHYRAAEHAVLQEIADERTNGNLTQFVRECIRFGMKKLGKSFN